MQSIAKEPFHIHQLYRKNMAKPKPAIYIQLNKPNLEVTSSDDMEDKPIIIKKIEEYTAEEDIVENDAEKIVMKKHTVLFKDVSRQSDINRKMVLDKIRRFSNANIVKTKKIGILSSYEDNFKIPLVEQEPFVINKEEVENPNKIKTMFTIGEKIGEEMGKPMEEDIFPDELPDIKDLDEEEEVEEAKEPAVIKEPEAKEEEEKEEEPVKIGKKIVFKKAKKPKMQKEEEEAKEEEKREGEEKAAEPEQKENEPTGKKKQTKRVYERYQIDAHAKIGKKLVINRLPKREQFNVRTSQYYMNNRKMYIEQIEKLFRPYRKEILDNAENASCDTQGSKIDFKLLTHQKVVRDYLNLYTPYRGLLLYHGLGSGKTCTSIAIAEGMKTNRRVIVMTPASLKMNFFSEIKKCGDVMYKKNQYWEFISIVGNPDYVDILANVLHIPKETIIKKKGAWLVDVTKKTSNFDTLDTEKQTEIDEQLDQMIQEKYWSINYNGLSMAKWKEYTNDNTVNIFDNSTILIDEAHNFVSRIVNKINKPDSLSYMLYDSLMKANNVKVVLLTGTPIVNYTNELGILFNILRGYIKQWTFQLNITSTAKKGFKLNKEEIMHMLDRANFNTYDYIEYSGNKLMITRNPYGFINTNKRSPIRRGGKGTKKIKIIIKPKKNKTKKAKEFNNQGFMIDNNIIKMNPEFNNDLGPLKMEETIEYNERIFTDPHSGGGIEDDYDGVILDETGNITDEQFVRILKTILRNNDLEIVESGSSYDELKALPDDSETFLNMFIDKENALVKNENVFKKRILGLTSYFRSAQENLLPRFVKTDAGENIHFVPVEMSEFQFTQYAQIRKEEADQDKKKNQKKQKLIKKGKAEDIYNISSSYRVFSRAACNFVFPNPPGRPMPALGENDTELDENDIDAISAEELPDVNRYISEEDVQSIKDSKPSQLDYAARIKRALKMLEYDPEKPEEEQYLTKDKLSMYSPKFLKILENLLDEDNRGLHLVYSQFRTIEGIELLKLIMEANGFAEFKIKKNSDSIWELDISEEDMGKPKFALHTGTESAEEKEIIRNIYNSSWANVPSSITTPLREISTNNYYGECIKILMITASGREGINLKNTRFVHIVEPYWNMVSIEQAIGRARRICSHQDLPEEDRTVKVFMYLSVFSESQKTGKQNIELMNRDTSRIDDRPITTDESLLDTSIIKDKINQKLLQAVKSTAMDCSLYNSSNKEENIVCYNLGKITSNAFASYPTLDQDMGELDDLNKKVVGIKLKKTKPIDGVVYAFDPNNMDLYDLESYEQAKQKKGQLILVGKLKQEGRRFVVDRV